MPITDKMVKNGCLSVKIQVFRTLFYGQMLRKMDFVRNPVLARCFSGLCIWQKLCRLRTGRIDENGHLSVNPDEILAEIG